jgi:hypothetical protein
MERSQKPARLSQQIILDVLLQGKIELRGQFTLGSNYTLLVNLDQPAGRIRAVYKPQQGEMPLWDFPPESLAGREVAAYLLSEALGWELVPPTVLREDGPFGPGSLQLFIPYDPELNYFSFQPSVIQRLKPAALFDLVINNADRKGSHILLDEDRHIWLIDHGLCFHVLPKLRTVIWDFAGQEIPANLIRDLESVLPELKAGADLFKSLSGYLGKKEIGALKTRILNIINQPVFPKPDTEKRQFPWPLV